MAGSTIRNGSPRASSQEREEPPRQKLRDAGDGRYQVLLETLRAAKLGSGLALKTVGLTSAKRGEGVTTVACDLAVHTACRGLNILLVDANFAHPALQRIFQLPPSPGLANLIHGDEDVVDCIHDMSSRPFKSLPAALKNTFRRGKGISRPSRSRTAFTAPKLSILTAGVSNHARLDLFHSHQEGLDLHFDGEDDSREFLNSMGNNFDLVIIDLPNVKDLNHSGFALSDLDGVIFVLEAEATSDLSAQKSLRRLGQHRANVLGVAFNKLRNRLPRWIDQKLGD